MSPFLTLGLFMAVLLACILTGAPLLGGLCVVLGHNWPIFFGFQGGKGIACSTAVLLLMFFWQGAVAGILCILVIYFTRYISLGSLTMLFVFALLVSFTLPFWPHAVWAIVLFLLGLYRHRSNIERLRNGTENKIGSKKK